MIASRGAGFLFSWCVAVFLVACSSGESDIDQWMVDQRKSIRPKIEKIQTPSSFVPSDYAGSDGIDPFSAQKLAPTNKLQPDQSNALLNFEKARRKEPLESYPLDNLIMVGSLKRNGTSFALIRADDRVHYVKQGQYLGQNFGKIMSVTDSGVVLREIVQDASGEWVERTASLELQEGAR